MKKAVKNASSSRLSEAFSTLCNINSLNFFIIIKKKEFKAMARWSRIVWKCEKAFSRKLN